MLKKRICLHCGIDIQYQPPKSSGCNHAHYPEACDICSKKASYQTTVTSYDIDKVSIEVPDNAQ